MRNATGRIPASELGGSGAKVGWALVWDGTRWKPTARALSTVTGSDAYTGANPVVAPGATTAVTGTGNYVASADGLLIATSTALTNSTGGTQGAYLWPVLTLVGHGGPGVLGSTVAAQVLANPLNNTVVTGSAMFMVLGGGQTYRLDYSCKAGTGAGNVTFSTLAMTYFLKVL